MKAGWPRNLAEVSQFQPKENARGSKMARRSSVHGLYINSTGWTGKADPVTAGNAEIHTEIAKEDVLLMKNGLMARRLKVTGRLKNPFPNGHTTSVKAMQNLRLGLLSELLE